MASPSTVSTLRASVIVSIVLALAGTGCKKRTPQPAVTALSSCAAAMATVPEATAGRAPHDANDLTFALYRGASCGDRNLAVSGFVTRHAIGALAAANPDRARILSRLGYSPRPAPGRDEMAAWSKATSGLGFTVGARIFYDGAWTLRPEVERRARVDFGAGLEELDFKWRPGAARERVGDWTGETTRGQVVGVPSAESLPRRTALVAATAFGLDATWRLPFDERMTLPRRSRSARARSPMSP